MMESKSETNTTQQATSEPWKDAIPGLQGILGQLGGMIPGSGVNPIENTALNTLSTNATGGNPYAPQLNQLAGDLFKGGTDRTGMVTDAYGRLQNQLQPFASGQYVDPAQNPGLMKYMDVLDNDAQQRVNGMFAASGRDLSPANIQAMSRGVGEAQAPVLANAYENERGRQMSSINSLYGAGTQATGLLSGLDQTAFGNSTAGIPVSQAAMQSQDYGPQRQLEIEGMRRGIPMQNLGWLTQMLGSIGSLGGQKAGTGQSETTSFDPLGWAKLGTGFLFPKGLSDRRLKTDIVKVGALFDGTPVYRYRYIGGDTAQIGLMAQDVELETPDAVFEFNGIKFVDYVAATEPSIKKAGMN